MTRTVLIADDEPNIVVSLEFLLKREGHRVLIARDGAEALAMIRDERPALVLLDAMMPGLSGFDLCETLRSDPELSGIRIVMLTARSREADQARAMGAGADAFVAKPFSTRDLAVRIRELMP
ncbi:MAG: response regulator [Gemmobacter sp.]